MEKSEIKLGPGMALAALKKLFSDNEIAELYEGKRVGTFDIEITDLCNFKCGYCYANSSPEGNAETKPEQRLTLEEIKRTIDQAQEMDIRLFNIQGGEPTMNRRLFFEIAEYARPKFRSLVAFTNGSLFSEQDVRRISELEMSLCVKLDTLVPEHHDRLTQNPGSLRRTLQSLEWMKKYNVTVSTNSVATPLNYYDIPDVWRFSARNGFTPFVARNHYHGRTRENRDLQLTAEELGNLFKELQRIDVDELGKEKWAADLIWPRANACQRYRAGVFINHRGEILPCSEADPNYFRLGNVREESLKEILTPERLAPFRNIYDKLHGACSPSACEYSRKQQCYGCRVSAADVGLLRGKSFDKEFFGGDALCPHNKESPLTAEELGRKPLLPKWN